LRTNEWYRDAGKSARKWLYELADFMDVINDAQSLIDKVRKEA